MYDQCTNRSISGHFLCTFEAFVELNLAYQRSSASNSQIEMVLHRFFCAKNLSHHRLFLSASVQLMHNHRTSFYVPARLFNSMSQSSIFRKNVDFPSTHQNYILNPSSSAHRSHGLFARKKKKIPCKNRPQAAYRVFSHEPYVIRQNIILTRLHLQAPF